MYLNDEEKIKLSKNNFSILNNHYKRRKIDSKNYNYILKKSLSSKDNMEEERISLTEHSNILNEYEQELHFLGMKRKNINVLNNNNLFNENSDNHSNNIICLNNKIADSQRNNNLNIVKEKENQNENENENEDMIKISELFKLYHYLFIKSGLECVKPSRFVDYLANEINGRELNLSSKDNNKINFDHIKKIVLNSQNENDENRLIYKIIDEYFHCSFKNSILGKLIEKVNKILVNKNNNFKEKKNNTNINNIINDNNSYSCTIDLFDKSKNKKDKISHSSLLADKLKNNNYKNCFSLTNDMDIFNSIIYMSNKYSQNNKKPINKDKTIINLLEEFRELLKSFKDNNKEKSNIDDNKYLNYLLKNKQLKKYINKNLISIKESFNNNILNILDKNNFYKLINLLFINNKIEDNNKLDILSKIKEKDISSFLILINFIIGITILTKYPNQTLNNDYSLLNLFFQYIKQFDFSSSFSSDKNIKRETKQKIRKIKIKKENKNKIKIKIKDSKDFLSDNCVSLIEEQKIEEESKVKKNNNISKMFFKNDNDISFDDDNQKPNKDSNNIIINNYKINTQDFGNNNYTNYNLINNDIKSLNGKKNKSRINKTLKETKILSNHKISNDKNLYNDCLNLFQKNLLKELSLGNDIFKISYSKSKEKKIKINKEKESGSEHNKEININISNISDGNTNIKFENNSINTNNNSETKIIQKKGNKIIIFSDDYFEGNNVF